MHENRENISQEFKKNYFADELSKGDSDKYWYWISDEDEEVCAENNLIQD